MWFVVVIMVSNSAAIPTASNENICGYQLMSLGIESHFVLA